ncbi:flagellar regulator YcgR PilZN domain-containing protein [Methylomagnum ishizawai]|uniref:flagellar regulator YcgR PilZN domain-containing protein n=1 Tax=Methylomagnum ishizawai TaxID=1760988 RepID=UPI001C33EC27|nr:flagellar regulator YcgR PilZN domain-containing protein [Methylomagnum ishizawai]BBL73073.1 hypothetical protein MishRS11D_01710 [Methylomagnum ishizawai]
MLDKLRGLLESKPPAQKKLAERGSWNPNFITDPVRIASFLNDLAHQRTALFLQLDDRGIESEDDQAQRMTTYLYKVGTERAALHTPDDPEDDQRLRAAGRFKVITDIYNNILTFPTEIIAIQEEGGQSYYIINLPGRVYYPKNQKPRQIRIDRQRNIHAYLRFFEPAKSYRALIDDLSAQGMGVLLSSEDQTLPYVRKGDKLKACSIGLGTRQYPCEARVNQVKRIGDKAIRIDCGFVSPGAEFLDAVAAILKGA